MGSPYSNRRNFDLLRKADLQRKEEQNKRLNISVAGAEKLGVSGGEAIREFNTWEVMDAVETEKASTRKPIDRGYTVRPAPTINPDRPRATKIAYSRDTKVLVVRFRGPKGDINNGPWIAYEDIPLTMWVQLKASNSTGRYLLHSGLDNYPYYHFNPDDMPEDVKVLFNS